MSDTKWYAVVLGITFVYSLIIGYMGFHLLWLSFQR